MSAPNASVANRERCGTQRQEPRRHAVRRLKRPALPVTHPRACAPVPRPPLLSSPVTPRRCHTAAQGTIRGPKCLVGAAYASRGRAWAGRYHIASIVAAGDRKCTAIGILIRCAIRAARAGYGVAGGPYKREGTDAGTEQPPNDIRKICRAAFCAITGRDALGGSVRCKCLRIRSNQLRFGGSLRRSAGSSGARRDGNRQGGHECRRNERRTDDLWRHSVIHFVDVVPRGPASLHAEEQLMSALGFASPRSPRQKWPKTGVWARKGREMRATAACSVRLWRAALVYRRCWPTRPFMARAS